MLCDQELSEFYASVNEISQASQDSIVITHFQPTNNKFQEENAKLKLILAKSLKSSREVIAVLKNEQYLKSAALCELEATKRQMDEIQKQCDLLQNENVNIQFGWREKFEDLEMRNKETIKSYIELAKDYMDVLSEATVSYCFEINRRRYKIVNSTEKFLKSNLEKFEMPQIISRRGVASKYTIQKSAGKRTLNNKPNEQQKEVVEKANRKRRKVENFDMQSISQVTSPASFYEEETISEVGSTFSFNTFSIGNETSYSVIESRMEKVSQSSPKCKCHEEGGKLVSIGVDTEDLNEPPPPSVPLLSDVNFDVTKNVCLTYEPECHEVNLNEIEATVQHEEDAKFVSIGVDTEDLNDPPQPPSVPLLSDVNLDATENACLTFEANCQEVNINEIEAVVLPEPIKSPEKNSTSIGINTEILTCNKYTSTIHSTTTRGTSTPQIVSKNFGTQYPEINYEKIFEETIFELPDFISPIDELESLNEEVTKEKTTSTTRETQTTLLNVCREVDYVAKTANSSNAEEQSFNLLGKSVFNIFLERLRKSNKTLDDEAAARERLWSYMQQQFFDRFEELTFDDYFNPSFLHETEKNKDVKGIEEKENYEETPKISPEELKIIETTSLAPLEVEETIEPTIEEEQSKPIQEIPETIVENSLVDDLFDDVQVENENKSITYERSPSPESIFDERSPSPASLFDDLEISDTEESDCISLNNDYESSDEELNFIEYDSPMSPTRDEDRGDDYFNNSPKSPPPFARDTSEIFQAIEIPLDGTNLLLQKISSENPLTYNKNIRQNLVQWQQRHAISSKESDKILCKIRKAIQVYLDSEWNDENLEICHNQLEDRSELLLLEAIYETVEDNDWQTEINTEFTPPAPPLPRYQQKLIVLIKKLAESYQKLPHMLIEDLETKLFKFESGKTELAYLRNMGYYYSSLVDLFFEGSSSMVFYFIVKCIYFYGCKAIPMVFVLIKATPQALPKKSNLLRKHSTNIDWDNMTGLELSKIRIDLEWVDSLDLTVIYLLTSIQMYRRKDNDSAISEHELFNYLPKFYGFPLNFLAAPKLLDILVKRLEDGEFTNLSLSLILLAKRMNVDFTLRTLLKGKLLPFFFRLIKEISESMEEKKIDQICILIDAISSILKAFTEEKDKSFKEIFPLIVNALGRAERIQKIQECCIRAILRLQRFIDNNREIYDILEKHYQSRNSFSESLRLSIVTFIHRKNEIYLKK